MAKKFENKGMLGKALKQGVPKIDSKPKFITEYRVYTFGCKAETFVIPEPKQEYIEICVDLLCGEGHFKNNCVWNQSKEELEKTAMGSYSEDSGGDDSYVVSVFIVPINVLRF